MSFVFGGISKGMKQEALPLSGPDNKGLVHFDWFVLLAPLFAFIPSVSIATLVLSQPAEN